MPMITNKTDRPILLLRWKFFPGKGKALDPFGVKHRDVPDTLAYSDRAKALADQGIIAIEGYVSRKSSMAEDA